MASDVSLNRSGLDDLLTSEAVQSALREQYSEPILADARRNLKTMGAYDTGDLSRSGRIEDDPEHPGHQLVGFDVPYAHVVHDGLGRGRNDPPRPYLAEAAIKRRQGTRGGAE